MLRFVESNNYYIPTNYSLQKPPNHVIYKLDPVETVEMFGNVQLVAEAWKMHQHPKENAWVVQISRNMKYMSSIQNVEVHREEASDAEI